MQIALIGYGNIGATLARLTAADAALAAVSFRALLRLGRTADIAHTDDLDALLGLRPDLVIECAGHGAVAAHVARCLAAGIDTIVTSVGALADDALHTRLLDAARQGKARLILPAGAIGGIDLLAALQPSGITAVSYEGRKPPAAWKGSPAERATDLDTLTNATTFFDGSARQAAADYPKNANVAATLALAGIGMDATRVQLIADPKATGNTHSYTVTAGGADMAVTITGKASPDNPRTSVATVYSLLREVRNRVGPQAI